MKTEHHSLDYILGEFARDAIDTAYRANLGPGPAARRSHWPNRGWGWRYLDRFKTVGGKRYQLHATRGWKCIGRATA